MWEKQEKYIYIYIYFQVILRQSALKRISVSTDSPEFIQHPNNQTLTEGDNATFNCDTSGNPSPTLSWTKDGSVVNVTSRISLSLENTLLVITNVNRGDSGQYVCVSANVVGTVQSSMARLNVQCKKTLMIIQLHLVELLFKWHSKRILQMSDFICICSFILWELESFRNNKGTRKERRRVTLRYHGSIIAG